MALTFDPDDIDVMDGLVAVTVNYKDDGVISDSGTISEALSSTISGQGLRREVTIREVEASGGRLQITDTIWELPQSTFTTKPTTRDEIVDTDNTETFRVLQVDGATLNTRWRVAARAVTAVA